MKHQKKSLGEFRAGRYVCHSSYPCMAAVDIEHDYGWVVRVDVENSEIIYILPDWSETHEFRCKYPPPKLGGLCHETIEIISKKDIPRSWRRKHGG